MPFVFKNTVQKQIMRLLDRAPKLDHVEIPKIGIGVSEIASYPECHSTVSVGGFCSCVAAVDAISCIVRSVSDRSSCAVLAPS